MNSLPIYIAIEGAIGVGKTTLATILQPAYQAKLLLEVFEENPFLPLFYQDAERYAFHVQIEFLLSRYHQQRAVQQYAGSVPLISDYLFAKDRLFARMNLDGHEWNTYHHLHQTLAEQIITPDLIIYLRSSVDTLLGRIAQRGRPYERSITRRYLTQLSDAYEEFFCAHQATAVVTIDTDELNIFCPDDLASIREQITSALAVQPSTQILSPSFSENGHHRSYLVSTTSHALIS